MVSWTTSAENKIQWILKFWYWINDSEKYVLLFQFMLLIITSYLIWKLFNNAVLSFLMELMVIYFWEHSMALSVWQICSDVMWMVWLICQVPRSLNIFGMWPSKIVTIPLCGTSNFYFFLNIYFVRGTLAHSKILLICDQKYNKFKLQKHFFS